MKQHVQITRKHMRHIKLHCSPVIIRSLLWNGDEGTDYTLKTASEILITAGAKARYIGLGWWDIWGYASNGSDLDQVQNKLIELREGHVDPYVRLPCNDQYVEWPDGDCCYIWKTPKGEVSMVERRDEYRGIKECEVCIVRPWGHEMRKFPSSHLGHQHTAAYNYAAKEAMILRGEYPY